MLLSIKYNFLFVHIAKTGGTSVRDALQPLRYNTKESLLNPHFLVFGDSSRDWSSYL